MHPQQVEVRLSHALHVVGDFSPHTRHRVPAFFFADRAFLRLRFDALRRDFGRVELIGPVPPNGIALQRFHHRR